MRPDARHAVPGWVAPALVLVGAAVLLVGFVPYSEGYGWKPVPLGTMLGILWTSPEAEDWHHGMLVPFVCLGLLYWKRGEILGAPVRPSAWGLAITVIALLLFYAGRKAGIHYVGFFSFQLLLAGLVIWMFGWPMMRVVAFPWAFLVFAWPLPFLADQIAVPLRHVMATLSAGFLNLVGVPTLRVGTSLRSAADAAAGLAAGQRFALDVANPCSGIRSLFALLMVSALYGYVTFRSVWKQGALVVAAAPLAVLGNFVRMLMLTFGTICFGSEFALGTIEMTAAGPVEHSSPYHMVAGFAVFGAALAGMLGVAWLLNRDWTALSQSVLERLRRPAPAGAEGGEPGAKPRDTGDPY